MIKFLQRLLSGLDKSYLLRQYFFGVLIAIVFLYPMTSTGREVYFPLIVLASINTLLYPYARFVYESIMDFIIGSNRFWFSGPLLIAVFMFKLVMMLLVWSFAIFVAPIGMLYLYFRNGREENPCKAE